MKGFIKYLISTVVFCLVYSLMQYLFDKNIDWKMIIVSTIIYGIIYPVVDIACAKLVSKK